MKNKKFRIPLIIFGVAIAVWALCSFTGMLATYKISSDSCYPTIKNNERFVVSRLVKPKQLNFICFYTNTPGWGRIMMVCRLCALGGDSVQLKNGNVYVNGKNINEGLDLANDYIVTKEVYAKYKDNMLVDEEAISGMDSFPVSIRNAVFESLKIPARKIVFPADSTVDFMNPAMSIFTNPDNSRPFVVPKDSYFVLGDNRHAAQDSRFIGFIPVGNFYATVLFK